MKKKVKRFSSMISLILTFAFLCGLFAVPASASPPTVYQYYVCYMGHGNDEGPTQSWDGLYDEGSTVTVRGNTEGLAKHGYTFAGWSMSTFWGGPYTYHEGDTFIILQQAYLYAIWERDPAVVLYDANGATSGTVPTDNNVYIEGDTVATLGNTGNLEKTGYVFAGWNTMPDGGGDSYSPGDSFTKGESVVTLYAVWEVNPNLVMYHPNGATSGTAPVDENSYSGGDTVTVLDNTGFLENSRIGYVNGESVDYTFGGWNTESDGSGMTFYGGNTFIKGSGQVTLYTRWDDGIENTNTYMVYYAAPDKTGGTVPFDSNLYYEGNQIVVIGKGNIERAGYTFSGWNTKSDGSGMTFGPGGTFIIGSGNIQLYAMWQDDGSAHTVTYNGNGATGGTVPSDTTSYSEGSSVTVLGNTGSLEKTGYTFSGWNTAHDGSGTSYSAGSTFSMGTSNVMLYAIWTDGNAESYTVTYNGNGARWGTVPADTNSYTESATVTVLGNTGSLARSNYTFAGWDTVFNGMWTHYNEGDTFSMGTSNVTLYAAWTANPHMVIYDGNGATGGTVPVDTNSYSGTDTVTVLGNTGNLTKAGCTFNGWNTEPDGYGYSYSAGEAFSMEMVSNDVWDVTLYAMWDTAETYMVTYDGNDATGGTVPDDGNSYAEGDTVTVLDNTGSLEKAGCTFAGWNTAADGSGIIFEGGYTFKIGSGNITLYARWDDGTTNEDEYTVTYDGNGVTGGSVPSDTNRYAEGGSVTVLGNTGSLVRTNYTFAGWNTAYDGSGTAYVEGDTFTIGLGNITLYAVWISETETVLIVSPTSKFWTTVYMENGTSYDLIRFGEAATYTVSMFKSEVSASNGGYLKIFDKTGNDITNSDSSVVSTGCVIKLYSSSDLLVKTYGLVQMGDINGDGYLRSTDFIALRNYITGKSTLDVYFRAAADVNADKYIRSTDFILIRNHVNGKSVIDQTEEIIYS